MGYRIEYTDGCTVKRPAGKGKKGIVSGVCVLLLAVTLLHPRGRLAFRDAVLPGDEAITVCALEELVGDLKDGEDVHRAISAFCHSIIAECET